MRARHALLAGALVLALGVWLRVAHAGQRDGLWGDEVQDLELVAAATSVGDLVTRLETEGHPPLHYLIEYGFGDRYGRWVPLLFGSLTVAALFLLAWTCFGPGAGVLAALLAAASPCLICYSSELRCYALYCLLGVVSALALVRFLRSPTYPAAALWGASAAALLYTHYFGLWFVAGGGGYALLRDRRHPGKVALAAVVCAALFAPWLPHLAVQLHADLQPWYRGSPRAWKLLAPFWILAGPVGVLLVLWATLRAAGRARRHDASPCAIRAFRALFWSAAGGALLGFGAQLLRGPYAPRYLLPMALSLLPITGWILADLYRRRPRLSVALVLALLVSQQVDPLRWTRKQPGAAAPIARRLEASGRPGDLIWFSPAFAAISVNYHYRGPLTRLMFPYVLGATYINWGGVMERGADTALQDEFLADLEAHVAGGGRVWFVTDGDYPIDRAFAWSNEPIVRHAPLWRQEVSFQRRALRLLYDRAEDVYQWDGPKSAYREPLTLILFDPGARK